MTSSPANCQDQGIPIAADPAVVPEDARISEFLRFQEEMDRCDAEEATATICETPAIPSALAEEPTVAMGGVEHAPIDTGSNVSNDQQVSPVVVPPVEAGTLAAPIEVETVTASEPVVPVEVEPVSVLKPSLPAKRVIVLGLPALSAAAAAPTKSRKRPCPNPEAPKRKRCAKTSEAGPSSSKTVSLGPMSRYRAKFASLIDGMISECGTEIERMAKELAESQERSTRLEGKLKAIEGVHSAEIAQFEARISDLERDLGKTASSLLKAKEAKKAKATQLRRLRRKMKGVEGPSVREVAGRASSEEGDPESASAAENAPGVTERDEGAAARDSDVMDEDETPCAEDV